MSGPGAEGSPASDTNFKASLEKVSAFAELLSIGPVGFDADDVAAALILNNWHLRHAADALAERKGPDMRRELAQRWLLEHAEDKNGWNVVREAGDSDRAEQTGRSHEAAHVAAGSAEPGARAAERGPLCLGACGRLAGRTHSGHCCYLCRGPRGPHGPQCDQRAAVATAASVLEEA